MKIEEAREVASNALEHLAESLRRDKAKCCATISPRWEVSSL